MLLLLFHALLIAALPSTNNESKAGAEQRRAVAILQQTVAKLLFGERAKFFEVFAVLNRESLSLEPAGLNTSTQYQLNVSVQRNHHNYNLHLANCYK